MKIDKEIEKIKTNIFSGNRETVKESIKRLFEIGGQNNIDYLFKLLGESDSTVINSVALTFRENKFNEGLEPLLKSIKNEKNKNIRGTMVYALQTLDCKTKLKELFDILFTAIKNWEVQSGILTILEEQEFEFKEQDLIEIKEKWNRLKDNWDEINGIEKTALKKYEIDRDLIQEFIDGYDSYLERS